MHINVKRLVIGMAVLLGATQSAWSHHSFSAVFDAAAPVELQGVVTETDWINPHIWITVDVTTGDGAVETWRIEAGSPNSMFRRGLRKSSLPVGTEVVVRGYQALDGSNRANARELTLPDGQRLLLDSSRPGDGVE
ncbi:MAG: hypothetical protein GWN29_14335 [Gammaproteobacteria bacterium]|nr:hypothetical protein [Gammaproteobacteria bacterium]